MTPRDEGVTASAVVTRRDVGDRYPWPHYVGGYSDVEAEMRVRAAAGEVIDAGDHPFRFGEAFRSVRLRGDLSALDVGTVVATLCRYENVPPARAAVWPFGRMLRLARRRAEEGAGWIVAGGVEVAVDGAVVVGPECCCGLERWREWIAFAEGGDAPWSGHSPDPWIERLPSGDVALGYDDAPDAVVTPGALRRALAAAERDLDAFTVALLRWAERVEPRLARRFTDTFADSMRARRP
jgi:hypothetical protein